MEKLKIIESYRESLTQNGIVICTYILTSDNSEVDCIDMEYESQFPMFEIVIVNK
tara:strand:+ start:2087 stop:2251 length:165 start_codon:yes stop_codon:yes gene_type:complete